jgi:hypothetical protein
MSDLLPRRREEAGCSPAGEKHLVPISFGLRF